jgi:hypothetical protein
MAEHEFEPELSLPVPRPVRRRGGWTAGCGIWFLRLFILPHTIAGAVMLGMAILLTLAWIGVALFGVEMQGHVVSKNESHSPKSKSRPKTTTYTLNYNFTVDGRHYGGSTPVTAQEYATFEKGQPVPLRVLTWAPEHAHWPRVEKYSPMGSLGGVWFFALFWNGILSIFLWMAWGRSWYQWRLVRSGEPAIGTVKEMRSYNVKGGRSCTIRYDYTCYPPDGGLEQTYHGSVTVRESEAEASGLQIGDPVTVLYLPQRPKWSLLYRFADFEVIG